LSTGTSEHFPYYDTNIRPRWDIAIGLIMVTLAPRDVFAKESILEVYDSIC